MSIKNNTTALQALLEQANALPDAGSGGTVETVTVTICCALGDTQGQVKYFNGTELTEFYFEDFETENLTISPVKNSIFYFMPESLHTVTVTLLDGDIRTAEPYSPGLYGFLVASSDATLNIEERTGGLEG